MTHLQILGRKDIVGQRIRRILATPPRYDPECVYPTFAVRSIFVEIALLFGFGLITDAGDPIIAQDFGAELTLDEAWRRENLPAEYRDGIHGSALLATTLEPAKAHCTNDRIYGVIAWSIPLLSCGLLLNDGRILGEAGHVGGVFATIFSWDEFVEQAPVPPRDYWSLARLNPDGSMVQ